MSFIESFMARFLLPAFLASFLCIRKDLTFIMRLAVRAFLRASLAARFSARAFLRASLLNRRRSRLVLLGLPFLVTPGCFFGSTSRFTSGMTWDVAPFGFVALPGVFLPVGPPLLGLFRTCLLILL
jgi:hypothetical protein